MLVLLCLAAWVIPGAGHFPHWEQPEAFVQRLGAFADGRHE